MIVGILIIYFTSPTSNSICQLSFKRTNKSSIAFSSQSRSIAIGYLNNDNQLDLVVANSGTNNIEIFISNMNQITYSIVLSDFNNDTYVDIAVVNYGTHTIGVFLGYGNGTFQNPKIFSTNSSRPLFITIGDFNNDYQTDIIITNYGTDSIGIYLGNGDGSFQSPILYSPGYDSHPYSLAVADFNNDTYLDIAVANYGTNNIGIFLGYGNDTFTQQNIYSTGLYSNPSSIAIGDFNNDTQLDIISVDSSNGNIVLLLGYGNGTFAKPIISSSSISSSYNAFGVDDVNNDSQLDIIVAHGDSAVALADLNSDNQLDITTASTYIDNICILFGYGNGTFGNRTFHSTSTGSQPYTAIVIDFNNDNYYAIAVTTLNNNQVVIFFGFGNGSFELGRTFETGVGSAPFGIAFTNLNNNNNNRSQLVVTYWGTNSVGILTEYYAALFDNQLTYPIGIDSHPEYVITGDIDKDNCIDIISVNTKSNSISLILGFGNGSFTSQKLYSTGDGSHPSSIALGDFNNDNRSDFVISTRDTDSIGLLIGFNYAGIDAEYPYALTVNDLNNDSYLDIVVIFQISNNLGILFGNGNGSFRSMLMYSTGDNSQPKDIAIGDFNNDSYVDLAVANSGLSNIAILFGYGNGSFASIVAYSTGVGSTSYTVVLNDLNNDGHQDIVSVNYGTNNIGIFLGYGNGSFAAQMTYSASISQPQPIWASIAGFNNDDRLDIATANFNDNTVGILLGYGNGSFANVVTYSTGDRSVPSTVVINDFNDDQILDIVVANSGTSNLLFFYGQSNVTFEDQSSYPLGYGYVPYGMAVKDLNGDVRMDIVVSCYNTDHFETLIKMC